MFRFKELVCFQPYHKPEEYDPYAATNLYPVSRHIYYIDNKKSLDEYDDPSDKLSTFGLLIVKELTECKLTYHEMIREVKELIECFPTTCLALDEAKKNVERTSHRGAANKNYGNSYWYSGPNAFDGPIIVAESNGLFSVTKHPKFKKYGFRINTV